MCISCVHKYQIISSSQQMYLHLKNSLLRNGLHKFVIEYYFSDVSVSNVKHVAYKLSGDHGVICKHAREYSRFYRFMKTICFIFVSIKTASKLASC